MTTKIDIDTKVFVRFLLVVSGFVLAVFFVWRVWAALMIIAISFFLALALNPPVSVLARRLPGHSRIVATALSYVVVLLVLGVFVYIALPPLISQTSKFVSSLPQYIEDLSSNRSWFANLIHQYNLQDQLHQLVSGAQQQASGLAQGIGGSVVTGVSSILTGVVTLVTVLVLTFLMLIEGPAWLDRLWSLYADHDKLQRHRSLATKMYKVVSGYVNGQVLVASIAAAAGLTTLLILTYFFQVPVAAVIPLTGLIFITDLIPMIGATLGAIIVSLVLLFNDPAATLVFVVYFIIYQQIENNFIQPLVQSRTVALSALMVLTAIIIGINLLGLVGGIIAIPVAGCIRVIILDYLEHRRRRLSGKRALLAHVQKTTATASDEA